MHYIFKDQDKDKYRTLVQSVFFNAKYDQLISLFLDSFALP